VLLAAVLLVPALALTPQSGPLEADGSTTVPPDINLVLLTSQNHPGMMLVDWTVDEEAIPFADDATYLAYRLQWSLNGSANVSEAVIVRQNEPFTRLIIPNLSTGNYTATISGYVNQHETTGWFSTTSATTEVTEGASPESMVCPNPGGPHGHEEEQGHNDGDEVPEGEVDNGEESGVGDAEDLGVQNLEEETEEEGAPETPVLICVTPSGVSEDAIVDLTIYINTSSGGMGTAEAPHSEFVWGWDFPQGKCVGFSSTSCPANPSSDYFLARINYRDRAGVTTSRWWSAFDDDGHLFYSATQVLVPLRLEVGPPVKLTFDLSEQGINSITLEGELFKETESGPAPLEKGLTDEQGNLAFDENFNAIDPKDFINPCVEIYNSKKQFVNIECGYDGSPFSADPDTPGYWKMRLPAPTDGDYYKIFFVDRANYFGLDNVLLYNVKFAAEWAGPLSGSSRTRSESYSTAASFSSTTSGIDAVLRPAQQLQATVQSVPASYTDARIMVFDPISQRWAGGAMAKVDDENETHTWGANVTGLVQGRAYRIYFSFHGDGVGQRFWLVGGGDLTTAPGIVPGDDLTEPWPNRPYAVTVHNADGSLIDDYDTVCVALIRTDDSVAASSCNDGNNFFGSPGIVLMQRVLPGSYRAIAWRVANPSAAILVGAIEVPASGQTPFLGISSISAAGISNYDGQNLGGNWFIQDFLDIDTPTNSAVIIP
jgi:hypothetical protein